MQSIKLTELLQEIGKNARKIALETCMTKDIEADRGISDMNIDLYDGETIFIEFVSRYQGDGSPEMAIDLADVITLEATEAAIERELSIHNENQEEKRKRREIENNSRQEQAEADEKAEFERLKKKFEVDNAK